MMQEIDDAAKMWEKTKDPKYKDEWYKLIRRYINGLNIIERRAIPPRRSDEGNDEGNNIVK